MKGEMLEELGVPRAYWKEVNDLLQNRNGEFYQRLKQAEGGVIDPNNPKGPGKVTWDNGKVAQIVNDAINKVYEVHAAQGVRAPHVSQKGEYDRRGRHKPTLKREMDQRLLDAGIDPNKKRPIVRHKSQEEKEADYLKGIVDYGHEGKDGSGFGRTPGGRRALMKRVGPNHQRSMANKIDAMDRKEGTGIYRPGGPHEDTGYATRKRILDSAGRGSTAAEKQQIALDKSNAAFEEYLGMGFSQAQAREMATRTYQEEFDFQFSGVQ